ncbi:MAG: hypothetical protein WD844_10440 [Thermoleophilaceae bacterium]
MPAEQPPAPRFDTARRGRPLSRRALQRQRTIESALAAAFMPRYMERLREIEDELALLRFRLARERSRIVDECGDDERRFARRWHETVAVWRFDDLNELITRHNEWYPVEADLPVDPRTRDYVTVGGREFRRPIVDANWVLERFPATLTPRAPGRSS